MAAAPSPRFDHMVVLMFENRSFDNLLGYLYDPGERPSFEGVLKATPSNPIPPGLDGSERALVPAHRATNMDIPDPDPGEEHPHTNTQLFGTVDPPGNRFKPVFEMEPPFNAPGSPDAEPSMSGFVADYVNAFREEMGRLPRYDEYAQIMACYTPELLPVTSALARGFAVFDHWFCEVPSQTFANRSFFHAASSSGFVVNDPVDNFVLRNDAPTILERLEEARLPWRIYVDPEQIVSITGLIHARRLAPYFATRFSTIYDFYADAAAGTLPAYSFIEPNLVHPRSDMHPPALARIRRDLHLPPPAAMQRGERLLASVYNSVRNGSNSAGSNWKNTLLVVTFDEHGGTFDHVPPPRVPPPFAGAAVGQMGFTFERSGVRIPTIVVSAWVDAATIVSPEFRSTSVIRTLRERWSLGDPLTQRDAIAPDISTVLTRTEPRPPEEWPSIRAPPLGLLPELVELLDEPIGTLERQIFGAALAHELHVTGRSDDLSPSTVTHRQAREHLCGFHAALFTGVRSGRQH